MYRNASWGAIGVNVDFEPGLDLAVDTGFEGVDVPIGVAADRLDRESAASFQALYSERGLQMGPWGLPIRWQGGDEDYATDLANLPRLAAAAREVGAVRCATWVPSWSDTRDLEANWAFHLQRFGPVAKVLADHDCRLGLEFIGPATLRRGKQYEFVYTLPRMLELCAAIGPNVGLLLDIWHWYTSGGTEADLASLTNDQVVVVHVSDAPAGIDRDEQLDNQRLLPAASGVIDTACFMKHLARICYDGPVTVEPFNQELRDMENVAAAQKTKATLDTIFAMAGIA